MSAAKKRVMVVMALASLDGSRSYGGVDTACQTHLQGLIDHGGQHDYIVVGFNPANDARNDGEAIKLAHNVTLRWFNLGHRFGEGQLTPKVIRHELTVRKIARQYKPDVVHSHSPQWFIWRRGGARKMLTLHSYQDIGRTSFGVLSDYLHHRLIQPRSISNSDIITTVSREIQGLIENAGRAPVEYIPNSVDPSFGREPRTPPPSDRIRLLLVANVTPEKKVCDALKIVSSLRQSVPNIELLIAGRQNSESLYYKLLMDYIANSGVAGHVRFLGCLNRDELQRWIKLAHVGLSLSECESFGLAPLELLQAGLPLVATQVGVFDWHQKDFSERGVRIIRPGDVDGAVKAVAGLIARGDYAADERSAAYLKETFAIEPIMRRYVELYAS
jgi:glycosyltransferase involved in cell wall biosynthesis